MTAGKLKELGNHIHYYDVKLLVKFTAKIPKEAGIKVSTGSRPAQT